MREKLRATLTTSSVKIYIEALDRRNDRRSSPSPSLFLLSSCPGKISNAELSDPNVVPHETRLVTVPDGCRGVPSFNSLPFLLLHLLPSLIFILSQKSRMSKININIFVIMTPHVQAISHNPGNERNENRTHRSSFDITQIFTWQLKY
ncbi:hypothetical protein E2C01_099648 [Portunus trituberculatus]|uniref:Uncharacterized protein n=1 Tax=Portunus trituberculatus TaxID=210409 RepID=A0A5B7KHD4_PORTR|nr:hypothetical protein [Portunus trituberculatus]